jgi:hypothetical protein
MKLIINPTKLAETIATQPHLVISIIRVLEDAARLPQHRSAFEALLNIGVAIRTQSDSENEPIFP